MSTHGAVYEQLFRLLSVFLPPLSASLPVAPTFVPRWLLLTSRLDTRRPLLCRPLKADERLGEISCVAWNTSVAHILATSTMDGSVVVWDLKEKRPWCTLKDPHRSSVSEIVWHPEDGLYLITACDDDSRAVLRLWDLRSSTTTPLAEFVGHSKGVLSVDWCAQDPNYIASCGKDNHTYVWDVSQARPIADIPASAVPSPGAGSAPRAAAGQQQPANASSHDVFGAPPSAAGLFGAPAPFAAVGGFADGATNVFGGGGVGSGAGRRYAVRWAKKLPATLAGCSFDRKITIHNAAALGPSTIPQLPSGYGAGPETTFRKGPKWLRRPAGASFGFGGKLLVFGTPLQAQNATLRSGTPSFPKRVNICGVSIDNELANHAASFDQAMGAVDSGAADIRQICASKAAAAEASGNAQGTAEWTFLRMLFEPDTRKQVLAYLGYDAAAVSAEVSAYVRKDDHPIAQQAPDGGVAGADETPVEQLQLGYGGQQDYTTQQQEAAIADYGGWNNMGHQQQPQHQQPVYDNRDPHDIFSSGGGGPSAGDFFGAGPSDAGIDAAAGQASAASDASHKQAEAEHAATNGYPDANTTAASSSVAGGADESHASSGAGAATPAAAAAGDGASSPAEPVDPSAQYVQKRVPSAADDERLKRALLVGDFAAAVAVCFRQDRLDDALLLAASGSPELWAVTQQKYYQRKASSLGPLMSAILGGQLESLVQNSEVSSWRDTLASLCTYAKEHEFLALCSALGDRLASAGDASAAVLLYMVAQAVNKAIQLWVSAADAAMDRLPAIQDVIQKAMVLRRAVALATGGADGTAEGQPEARLLGQYVSALTEEGQLATAAAYSLRIAYSGDQQLQPTKDAELGMQLRDRLVRSFTAAEYQYPAVQALQGAPFPYQSREIGPAPPPVEPAPAAQYGVQQQDMMAGGGGQVTGYDAYGQPILAQPQQQMQQQQAVMQQHSYGIPQQQQPMQAQPQQYGHAQQQAAQQAAAASAYGAQQQQVQQQYQQSPLNQSQYGQQPHMMMQQPQQQQPPQQPMHAQAAGYGARPGVPAAASQAGYGAPMAAQLQQPQGYVPAPAPARAAPAPSMPPQAQQQAQPMMPSMAAPSTARPMAQQQQQPAIFRPGAPAAAGPAAMPAMQQQHVPQQQQMQPGVGFGAPQMMQQAAPAPAAVVPPPAPTPVLIPLAPEVEQSCAVLQATIGQLETVCGNVMEQRQLKDASGALELLKVSRRVSYLRVMCAGSSSHGCTAAVFCNNRLPGVLERNPLLLHADELHPRPRVARPRQQASGCCILVRRVRLPVCAKADD